MLQVWYDLFVQFIWQTVYKVDVSFHLTLLPLLNDLETWEIQK